MSKIIDMPREARRFLKISQAAQERAMQVEEQLLLPCPLCGLPNPRLYKFGGSWHISCDPRCGAKIWAATKSEAVAEWNGEPVNPALDA